MKKLLMLIIAVFLITAVYAEVISIDNSEYNLEVLKSNNSETIIKYDFGKFTRKAVQINGETYFQLGVKGGHINAKKGNPALPKFSRSIIIPNNAMVEVDLTESEYKDFHMKVIPSKGRILRNVNPADVPYTFSESYHKNEFLPQKIVQLGNPYILRDFRGVVVTANPFVYNPKTEILRVYNHLVVKVKNVGYSDVNVSDNYNNNYSKYFEEVYANHFLNFSTDKYELVDEHGRMIVICYDDFMDAVQPYVDWKNQKGIETVIYDVASIGGASDIEDFIQAEYDADDDLTFVQLIGDAAQVPTLSSGGGGADPKYALVDGNDPYMDIFVGRFSAENVAQVETQVERTVWYERDVASGDWMQKGMGVASNQGTGDDGEYDNDHVSLIRDKLMDYGYTEVDEIYDPSGTASQVANGLEDGRGIINYTGHGSNTSWSSTGFSNSDVNALENDYMLPFVNSVACVNGNFTGETCFAEAWMRATNDGNPTGAIAIFASSINQSWDPPMAAQDESVDMLTGSVNYDGTPEVMTTLGGLWYNGEGEMLDLYNDTAMSETWHIFGDASLQVRTKTPQSMDVTHLPNLFIGLDFYEVSTGVENAYVSLTEGNEILASGYTDSAGDITLDLEDPPVQPTDLTLTVTAMNKITYMETVSVIPNDEPYVIISNFEVNAGDDDIIEYGETVMLDLTFENVGAYAAANVGLEVNEDDEYIEFNDNIETIGDLDAEESITIENAVGFTVANDVPNNYNFVLNTALESDSDTWNATINLTAFAPVLTIDGIEIDDGDNNQLDPGDRADIIVTILNEGGAKVQDIMGVLDCDDSHLSFNDDTDELDMIEANNTGNLTFDVDVDSATEIGHVLEFILDLTAANDYSTQGNFSLNVGLILEDFESGNFSEFPWEFFGDQDWIIASDTYEGDYSAQSGDINDNQTSELSITMSVSAADVITFYKKVSSESNYDYFRFFIDDEQQAEWSGEVDWSEESFDVSEGIHTFKWVYEKDYTVSSGSDCAWLDYIIFPPAIIPTVADLEFSDDAIEVDLELNSTTTEHLEITNTGDMPADYNIGLVNTDEKDRTKDLTGSSVECSTNEFWPGETVTWTFTVSCVSTDNEWIKDVWIEFPSGVNVLSSTNLEDDIPTDGATGDGATVHWGGSGYMTDGEQATAEVEVSISAGFLGDMVLPWIIHGDEWGSPPHEITGEMDLMSMGEPITWLSVSPTSGTIEGNSTEIIELNFDTADLEDNTTYTCQLRVVDSREETLIPVTLNVGGVSSPGMLPAVTELKGNYPNPFNPETTINYSLKETSPVSIKIYNIKGQCVRTLVNTNKDAGYHTAVWQGKDDNNKSVSSGVYFYRLRSGKYTSTKKMILMK